MVIPLLVGLELAGTELYHIIRHPTIGHLIHEQRALCLWCSRVCTMKPRTQPCVYFEAQKYSWATFDIAPMPCNFGSKSHGPKH